MIYNLLYIIGLDSSAVFAFSPAVRYGSPIPAELPIYNIRILSAIQEADETGLGLAVASSARKVPAVPGEPVTMFIQHT